MRLKQASSLGNRLPSGAKVVTLGHHEKQQETEISWTCPEEKSFEGALKLFRQLLFGRWLRGLLLLMYAQIVTLNPSAIPCTTLVRRQIPSRHAAPVPSIATIQKTSVAIAWF